MTTTVQELVDGAELFEWPEPEPLIREIEPPEPYPIDALGDVLAPAARVLHEIIRAPDSTCGQSVLAAGCLAAQGHADVVMDGRRMPLSENFINVLETGGRKSAVDRAALGPVSKRQRDLEEKYEEDAAKFELEAAVWKKDKDEAVRMPPGKREAALEKLGLPPSVPPEPILTTEEPTYEGLVKSLQHGWPSTGIFSDEGGRFLGGYAMSEDHRLKTMAGLSSLWDGRPITRTRGSDGHVTLYGRRVAMNLLVQPAVADVLFGNRLAHEQGFLSRCLVSRPLSPLGDQKYVERDHTEDPAYRRYFARLMDILETELPWERMGQGDEERNAGGLKPRELQVDPDAKPTWIAFHDWVQDHLKEDGFLRAISGLAAKAPEHALRLAGVLALVDDLEVEAISRRHVEAGITLARFYLTEAQRLFNAARVDPDLQLAGKLLTWLWTQHEEGKRNLVYTAKIYQYGPNAVRDQATTMKLMNILSQHQWVRRVDDGARLDGAHRKDVWEVRDVPSTAV